MSWYGCVANGVAAHGGASLGPGSRTATAFTGPLPTPPRFRPQSCGAAEMSVATRSARSRRTSVVVVGRRKALLIEKNENYFAAGVSGSQASTRPSTNPQRLPSRAAHSTGESRASSQMESPTKTRQSPTARNNSRFLSDSTKERSTSTPTSKGMNKGRNTPTSMHSWWGDPTATAPDLHDGTDPRSDRFKPADKMKWDRLTIRQWFSFMGVEAKEMKHVMSVWRELDVDNNRILDFDEFVEIFKRVGHYFKYRVEANPPEPPMASIISGTKENALAHTFMHLSKLHLPHRRRPSIELEVTQQITAESPTAAHMPVAL